MDFFLLILPLPLVVALLLWRRDRQFALTEIEKAEADRDDLRLRLKLAARLYDPGRAETAWQRMLLQQIHREEQRRLLEEQYR